MTKTRPLKTDFASAHVKGRSTWIRAATALGILLAASQFACAGSGENAAIDERPREPQAEACSLEVSPEALTQENAQLEKTTSKTDSTLPDKEQWSKGKDKGQPEPEATILERTARLVEGFGGEVYFVDHAERGQRSVLLVPWEVVDGETPLIVSLHGFGGDAAYQTSYVPLHERVDTDGFALLLPNGSLDGAGRRFWNPTDQCCDGGKSGKDDVAYLTELVSEARKIEDVGQVYFFGYSNGGFMSYHTACKGLPCLRAVASLAGTSYVDDSSCEGAPPVSVLHIHGTADDVILFEGDVSEPDPNGGGETEFYAVAREMVTRWSRRAAATGQNSHSPRQPSTWTSTCRGLKPGRSTLSTGAPMGSQSSSGWARAAAMRPLMASPL